MIKLQCINCGHIQNYLKSDLVKGLTCDLCGGSMVLPEKDTPKIAKQDLIIQMEQQIKELGHAKVWEMVESWTQFKIRLGYRQLFLKAGGIIPKTKV